MATYKRGRHGLLYLGTDVVTGLTDFGISDPHSMVDTTVMGDSYATQLKDVKGPWTASFSAKTDDTVLTALVTSSKLEPLKPIKFYPDRDAMGAYFYGTGVFSLDQSVAMGDTVNFSGTIDGSGELLWF